MNTLPAAILTHVLYPMLTIRGVLRLGQTCHTLHGIRIFKQPCPFIGEWADMRDDVCKQLKDHPLVIRFGVGLREQPYRIQVTILEGSNLEEVKRSILAGIPASHEDHFRFETGRLSTLMM